MAVKYDKILGEVREADEPDLSGYLQTSNNLTDLDSASDARDNLGLGTMALEDASDYIPISDYSDFVNVTGDTMTGALNVTSTGFNAVTFEAQVSGEDYPRFAILNRGDLAWGPGDSATYDTFLTRALGGVLDITDSLQLGGSFVFQGGTSGVIGFGFFEDGSLRLENNYSLSTDEFYIDILDSTGAREQLYRAFTSSTIPLNYWQFYGFENATGTVQIGGEFTIHSARLAVEQDNTSRAVPVLYLEQADVSEEIFEIVSTEGAGNAISDYSSLTLTGEELIKITVNGATRYLVAYSGA